MDGWTADKVLALAPDSASASAGQGLANARKWTGLGANDRAVWGLCQGSGKDPYQARVDLGETAFKCSCPSRKFPCKHGLALLLLFAQERPKFAQGAEPSWVSDWLDGRGQRAEKKAEKAKAIAEAPIDLEAQAKRAAQRDDRVRKGVGECRTWMEDLVRRGLASAQRDAGSEWEHVAARMVDAQAPGLAGYIRRVPEMLSSGPGWEGRTLDLLGRLHLLVSAAERLDELPPELVEDVRTALGYAQSKEAALLSAGVADRWLVLGQAYEEDGRLTAQRTWLRGEGTGQEALVLEFAVGAQPLDTTLVPGTAFEGEVAFYPSRSRLRGLVKSRGEGAAGAFSTVGPGETVEAGLMRFAQALATNPWIGRWPLVISEARLAKSGERWLLQKGEVALPLAPRFERGMQLWRLLSATGGGAATVVAEWDGERADPIGAFVHEGRQGYVNLCPRWVA